MKGYGYCPICGATVLSRERRLNGNDKCENGHMYPSRESLAEKPVSDEDVNKARDDERAAVIRYLDSLVDEHRVAPGYVDPVGAKLQAAIVHIGNARHRRKR